jgi:hypothetical protein
VLGPSRRLQSHAVHSGHHQGSPGTMRSLQPLAVSTLSATSLGVVPSRNLLRGKGGGAVELQAVLMGLQLTWLATAYQATACWSIPCR